jgi:rhodanese-related sulfurtransferase
MNDRPVNDLIEPEELKVQHGTEAAPTIIDVRGADEYESGHIQGAIHIPASQLPKKLKKISRDRPVVTYCNMHHPGSSRGESATSVLRENGYKAQALNGGYPAWKEAGLPVEEATRT